MHPTILRVGRKFALVALLLLCGLHIAAQPAKIRVKKQPSDTIDYANIRVGYTYELKRITFNNKTKYGTTSCDPKMDFGTAEPSMVGFTYGGRPFTVTDTITKISWYQA